ncbi:hypothetical protein HDU98_002997 [Podochytrium sp. JEL0797]|nr:hypothetical protein HDU98_002997 [Podochytrium sp. JEL0797]
MPHPSCLLFLVSGLLYSALGVSGLVLLRAGPLGGLTAQDVFLPGPASKAGDLALEIVFTGMLCFAGLPSLLTYFYAPKNRTALLALAIPTALYHLMHLVLLFSSFNGSVPLFGPSESVVPLFVREQILEQVPSYRVGVWILNASVHVVLYVWSVVWIMGVRGGAPKVKRE